MVAQIDFFRRCGVFFILCFFWTPTHSHAEVSFEKNDFSSYTINIFGTITKSDAHEIALRETDFAYSNFLIVYLDSVGGDVVAAQAIGRTIRKNDGRVIVNTDAKCLSSCALIYIAGVSRGVSVTGMVGLHRPYFASLPQSRQTLERETPLMLQSVKNYVQEMGVQDRFYQIMVNTEPAKMKLYGLSFFGRADIETLVPNIDPTFQEIEISYAAREYGTSTAEMRSRKTQAIEQCNVVDFDCTNAMKWGLTKAIYKERNARTRTQCYGDGDQVLNALHLIKAKERPNHPLFLKREACVRDIMLAR